MTTKPATPLPWTIETDAMYGAKVLGPTINGAQDILSQSGANAAYIVAACNAYPELVAALRHLVNMAMTRDDQAREDALCTSRALLAKLGEGA